MNNNELIKCENCGATNNVSAEKVQQGNKPLCGQCGERLDVGSFAIIAKYETQSQKTNLFLSAPVIIACFLIIILAVLWAMRWDYGATKSHEGYVVKWKTDQWAKQGWIERYTYIGKTERPSRPGTEVASDAWDKRIRLGDYWTFAFIASVALLLWGILIHPRYKKKRLLPNFTAGKGYYQKTIAYFKVYADISIIGLFYALLLFVGVITEH